MLQKNLLLRVVCAIDVQVILKHINLFFSFILLSKTELCSICLLELITIRPITETF